MLPLTWKSTALLKPWSASINVIDCDSNDEVNVVTNSLLVL